MITEDYVSFETAKLLKEKEFDGKCHAFYRKTLLNNKIIDKVELHISTHLSLTNSNLQDKLYKEIVYCVTPTLQMAMKWLREVHNKIIVPNVRVEDSISGIINCYIVGIWYIPKNNNGALCFISPTPENGYSTYEEACEAAIKYCLENLI